MGAGVSKVKWNRVEADATVAKQPGRALVKSTITARPVANKPTTVSEGTQIKHAAVYTGKSRTLDVLSHCLRYLRIVIQSVVQVKDNRIKFSIAAGHSVSATQLHLDQLLWCSIVPFLLWQPQ